MSRHVLMVSVLLFASTCAWQASAEQVLASKKSSSQDAAWLSDSLSLDRSRRGIYYCNQLSQYGGSSVSSGSSCGSFCSQIGGSSNRQYGSQTVNTNCGSQSVQVCTCTGFRDDDYDYLSCITGSAESNCPPPSPPYSPPSPPYSPPSPPYSPPSPPYSPPSPSPTYSSACDSLSSWERQWFNSDCTRCVKPYPNCDTGDFCYDDTGSYCTSKKGKTAIIGGAAGGGALLIIIIILCCWCKRRKKRRLNDQLAELANGHEMAALSTAGATPVLPAAPGALPTIPPATPALPVPPAAATAEALHPYTATAPDQLSLVQGEVLTILDETGDWWRLKNSAGEEGIAPSNYVAKKAAAAPVPAPVALPETPALPTVPPAAALPETPALPTVPPAAALPDTPALPTVPPAAALPDTPALPTVPPAAALPDTPALPTVPPAAALPETPALPTVPSAAALPETPALPTVPPAPAPAPAPVPVPAATPAPEPTAAKKAPVPVPVKKTPVPAPVPAPAATAAEPVNPFGAEPAEAETKSISKSEENHKAIFASAAVDAAGLLSAKDAGALLTKSGLKSTELRTVWTNAKKEGPKTCPSAKMDLAEFLIAARMAEAAGGVFPPAAGSSEA